jgi:aryl-alcohol dehydrogenase-like predicted oxidoreductase
MGVARIRWTSLLRSVSTPQRKSPTCSTAGYKEIEDSQRRLRTDVVDIYQLHWPDPNERAPRRGRFLGVEDGTAEVAN